jgi:hypothetical protein
LPVGAIVGCGDNRGRGKEAGQPAAVRCWQSSRGGNSNGRRGACGEGRRRERGGELTFDGSTADEAAAAASFAAAGAPADAAVARRPGREKRGRRGCGEQGGRRAATVCDEKQSEPGLIATARDRIAL